MITDGEKQHHRAVKGLPALLRGITSNHKQDFYCLNCFHLYNNHVEKSMKATFITYAECLL